MSFPGCTLSLLLSPRCRVLHNHSPWFDGVGTGSPDGHRRSTLSIDLRFIRDESNVLTGSGVKRERTLSLVPRVQC